jgi:hypothetical protein
VRPRRDESREEVAAADAEPPVAEGPVIEPPATERIEIVAAEESPVAEPPVAAGAETISLDPWSARYGLETASLAPFAGEPVAVEPFTGQTGEPESAVETGRDAERGWEHEAPGGFPEPETMPIAEAEEGIPFVSEPEREFEATDAVEHAAPQWGEPARPLAGSAPEYIAETGAGEFESGETDKRQPLTNPEPQPLAEPDDGESALAAPVFADSEKRELAATDAPVESASMEPAYAEPSQPDPAQPEPVSVPASPLADDVLVVTEKPANPRRGWWQRMTRS